ncbi:MAG: hypothetical protein LBJ41_01855 [Treponema sp.]|jgi:hypothetical protein|nr:hypothetical protein [Treponema sp.]
MTLEQKAQVISKEMENWAKENHPWDNQTSKLEESIASFVESKNDSVIVFGIEERMEYGKYVEKMKDKGVLEITKEHFMPDIKKSLLATAKIVFLEGARVSVDKRLNK